MLSPLELLLVVAFMVFSGSAPILQLAAQTKPECQSACGNLNISYPFGIDTDGSGCYYMEETTSFPIYCNKSIDPPTPYWSSNSSNIPVVDISLENHEMTVNLFVASDCYSKGNRTPDSTPHPRSTLGNFLLSSMKNRFIVVGCHSYAFFKFNGKSRNSLSTGCMSLCSTMDDVTNGSCDGVGCCETNSLPRNTGAYEIILGSFDHDKDVHKVNQCSYAFVAADNSFNFSTASLEKIPEKMMPAVLEWAVGNESCEEAQKDITSYMCKGENAICTDTEDSNGYRCHCKKGYSGNPYISGPHGCQDVNECEPANPCYGGICINVPGNYTCLCSEGTTGDPWKKDGCIKPINEKHKKSFLLEIVLGVGIGVLFLLSSASWIILAVRQRRIIKERNKFYRDNGGQLLESRLSQHRSYADSLKIFSAEDLKKATDNYDESRILGEGGQGTVYKGTVMNNKTVAIKKAKILDRGQVNDFINEVIILSQINHKNVVKLIGCCLETEMPLLVYEFITNGTLFGYLHGNKQDSALSSWRDRLRIAAETAGALSYLHTDAGTQIIHRDVKSTNILLDENYTVKVSDFGASRLMPSDQTQLTTLVQGTLGYLDPEYLDSGELTDKSDVYSFGIVLAELLTGMHAISFDKPEKERYLSPFFTSAIKENRCLEIMDSTILNENNGEQIAEVARLASRCLRVRGEKRPSMKEVALELEGLQRATGVHPWGQEGLYNLQESEHLLGGLHGNYSYTISTNATGYDDTQVLVPLDISDGR